MIRHGLLMLALVLTACRERGTIEIDFPSALEVCAPEFTGVRAILVEGGSCTGCACGELDACPACEGASCVRACDGQACPIDEARAEGISLEPPGPGQYAVIYTFTAGSRIAAISCAELVVEEDGTRSETVAATVGECCVP